MEECVPGGGQFEAVVPDDLRHHRPRNRILLLLRFVRRLFSQLLYFLAFFSSSLFTYCYQYALNTLFPLSVFSCLCMYVCMCVSN